MRYLLRIFLVALILGLLPGSTSYAMSDIDKQKYLDWLVKLAAGDAEGACWGGECIGVLAVAPNGCWAKHPDMSASKARAKALEQCASSCDSDSCEVVDVGGESDFIKQSGPSVSSASEANRSESEPSAELEFWASVKDSEDSEMFKAYLERYPDGKFVALANLRILKLQTVSKPKSSQSQGTGQTTEVELEFWASVKDSDDPEMFKAYLRQFPQGVYAGLAKLKIKKLTGKAVISTNKAVPDLDYGTYYALVIGNNKYDHLSALKTAVNDARSVATVLRENYGFKVSLLENATRSQIIHSIKNLREQVSSNDNALIYYAGHGYLDVDADEGYWLPVDSSDNPENWIMTDQVISQIRAMQAKHVMVVADSCFSGTIRRSLKIVQRSPGWIERIVKKKSRTALTAGGLEPVSDSGDGSHSVFAGVFISLLKENVGIIDGTQLFSQLRPLVMMNAEQTPEYGDIHRAGHAGGEFLFIRQ